MYNVHVNKSIFNLIVRFITGWVIQLTKWPVSKTWVVVTLGGTFLWYFRFRKEWWIYWLYNDMYCVLCLSSHSWVGSEKASILNFKGSLQEQIGYS